MFVGLDLGTTNVKAVLVEASGRVVARSSFGVSMNYIGQTGVEQDIEEIWEAALDALSDLGPRVAEARALGVSSQGGALQMLRADGTPAGPVISWMDGRGAPWNQRVVAELGHRWFAEHVGHPRGGITVGQILRLREEQPDLAGRDSLVGFVGDVVVGRLCGRRAHDATSLSLGMLYNPSLRRADPDLLERLGLREEQLPLLLPATVAAGPLRADVAVRTGLPEGIPVSPAIHDQYAAALGCGAVHPGDVMCGTGTAWVLLAVADRLPEPASQSAFICTHVVDGLYGQILSLGNGGSAFAWATEILGLENTPAHELEELMASVPPGSEGVRFWPFLTPGGKRSGRLSGLRLLHERCHILRAVVEGLACELDRHLRLLAACGMRPERAIMCGGAARGRLTPQIVADVTGLPLDCMAEPDVSAMGAAMVARALAEPGSSLLTLSERMRPRVRPFAPGPHAEFYETLAAEYRASLGDGE